MLWGSLPEPCRSVGATHAERTHPPPAKLRCGKQGSDAAAAKTQQLPPPVVSSEVPSFRPTVAFGTEESRAGMSARVLFAGACARALPAEAAARGARRGCCGTAAAAAAQSGAWIRHRCCLAVYTLPKLFGKPPLSKQAPSPIREQYF